MSTKKLLVVDDSAGVVALIEALFEPMGFQLFKAKDGRTGVRLAIEEQPAVVLLDERLPDLSGAQVLHELRARPETCMIPVILLSGGGVRHEVATALDATALREGPEAYLTKPFELDELVNRVRELTEGCCTGQGLPGDSRLWSV